MVNIIVEQSFELPPSEEEENKKAREIDRNLEKFGGRRLRTYSSLDGMRTICEFEAPDAEAIHTSYQLAEATLDKIWPAQVYIKENESPSDGFGSEID